MQRVVSVPKLKMFFENELQMLLSGIDEKLNLKDLQKHCIYKGGYGPTVTTVRLFWEVLATLEESELMLLIKFVTGCSRPPLLGFKHLRPPFTIQRMSDTDRLPISSTCFNILKLPPYKDASKMKEKVIKAITMASTGFHLT